MPSFRSSKDKATHAVAIKSGIQEKGVSGRHDHKGDGLTYSIGTERGYKESLTNFDRYLIETRQGDIFSATLEHGLQYLDVRSEYVTQKTLNRDREALQHHFGEKITSIRSELQTILSSRAYSTEQVELVARAQSARNSLSTEISHCCGVRAHELLTIRPTGEQSASSHREWSQNRFEGREGVIYTVAGKGGLVREVMLSSRLSELLEARRLAEPKTVRDREIFYKQHYDIAGGQAWSQSFSSASQRALGWSNGGHGLRHSYSQERMDELQGRGFSYKDALKTVSQEMGHFRPEITEVYLR